MRIGLICSTVVAATLAATVTATAGAAGCSRATAKAAVAQVKPRIAMLTSTPRLVEPADIDTVICFDFTRDGRTDVAATVTSGGTAGDIGWLVLVRTPASWKLGHGAGGYKIGLSRVGGDVVVSQPVYRKNDPNCCPTGGFDHERWHWNGTKFARMPLAHEVVPAVERDSHLSTPRRTQMCRLCDETQTCRGIDWRKRKTFAGS